MEKIITIQNESCIRCGKCVRVCPSVLFVQGAGSDNQVSIPSSEGCIICGHCVAACPTDSVNHSSFPPSAIHHVDYEAMPSPEQVLLLCRARRSNRAFSRKEIPGSWLDMILEAAHRAPTASNSQKVGFTLVTDPAKLKMISQCTIESFSAVVNKLENPFLKPILNMAMSDVYKQIPRLRRLAAEFERGNDLILRGATAVLLIHTPRDSRFGVEDANLAYQNGSLIAESLGVSQFYTGFVCTGMRYDKGAKLAKAFGIEGRITAGMALGLPSFRFSNYIDREPMDLRRF